MHLESKEKTVRKVHKVLWWLIKEAAESEAGKSLGVNKKQNGETHFHIGGCRIVNN